MADGGEKGSRLAQRLGMIASPDSLLRLIREAEFPASPKPTVRLNKLTEPHQQPKRRLPITIKNRLSLRPLHTI